MAMEKGQNYNHPVKGSILKVHPITKLSDIEKIKRMLSNNPRDYALFVVGINTALRASDLCRLTAGSVRGKRPGDKLIIREKKTKKVRELELNAACIRAINDLLASREFEDNAPLFYSQRKGMGITPVTVNRLIKTWCAEIRLKGNYGSHTLRKTFGYHQRKTFGIDIPTLMEVFGHSTQRQTLNYLCIQREEISNVYANEL